MFANGERNRRHKTAVSEAVTNAVVHAYDEEREENLIEICADIDCDNVLTVSVRDFGKGIADVEEAKEPFSPPNPTKSAAGWGSPSSKPLWTR